MSFLKIGKINIKEINFAITAEEQRDGLMYVNEPIITIFPYKKAEVRKFWMDNVKFPLDMIFCCKGKVIDILSAKPYDKKLVGSKKPCDTVIEVMGGMCAYNGIQIGDDIIIKYDKDNLKKFLSQ